MMRNLIALGYALCWGMGVTLTKIALSEIAAATLLVIQLFSSVVVLTLACYLKHRQWPFSWSHLKRGRAGIFEPALAYMVGIFGVDQTSASNAALIGSTEVILTVLLAAIVLREPLAPTTLMLAGTSFSGVFLLALPVSGVGQASAMGDALVLLGTVFAVCYVLVSKTQIASTTPLLLTAAQQCVGLLLTVACFGALSTLSPTYALDLVGIPLPFWLLAVVSGILQYAIAFLLYLTALQHVAVSQAAFYVALIPVFGVVSAIVLLGEQPSLLQWIGGALVIAASYAASLSGSKEATQRSR